MESLKRDERKIAHRLHGLTQTKEQNEEHKMPFANCPLKAAKSAV
jgi:hypothetical protein